MTGDSNVGTIDIVFAKVERIHIDDTVLTPDGKLDIPRIKPIARMGYYDYTVVSDTFEMQVPGADRDEAYGLAGQPA
ncbi:hypothetical protein [Nocardioides sp. B-3]|uniref:hypothetical protein n=1 Tax=Nocardioides sp. B-3 TaxID=2895565 RepID=UPI0021533620|nr:hypothetical protein [Nocardioides sp. B-3]UUZ60205.1 hypothetical protein LP418_04500 [Nocardioides sp. B-3]